MGLASRVAPEQPGRIFNLKMLIKVDLFDLTLSHSFVMITVGYYVSDVF